MKATTQQSVLAVAASISAVGAWSTAFMVGRREARARAPRALVTVRRREVCPKEDCDEDLCNASKFEVEVRTLDNWVCDGEIVFADSRGRSWRTSLPAMPPSSVVKLTTGTSPLHEFNHPIVTFWLFGRGTYDQRFRLLDAYAGIHEGQRARGVQIGQRLRQRFAQIRIRHPRQVATARLGCDPSHSDGWQKAAFHPISPA